MANFDSSLGSILTHKHKEHVLKAGDTISGQLNFLNQPLTSGDGVFISNASSYDVSVPSGKELSLINLNFKNSNTSAGLFYGIKITTDTDGVDRAAGLEIVNVGTSDALYLGVKGKSGSATSYPTGLGLDLNRGLSGAENSTANYGYGIQAWDWSQTDTGLDTPTSLYLNKQSNPDTSHVLAKLSANRNAMKFVVPQGGAYTGTEPLINILGGGSLAQRLVITANGKLQVGPNTPQLDIESNDKIGSLSTGNNVAVYLDSPSSGTGRIVAQDGSLANNGRNMSFSSMTNLLETARFETTGKMGIGTNAPAYKLDVEGAIAAFGGLYVDTLPTPATPVITNIGTTGSTTYGYKITFVTPLGETVGSTEGTTTTGNATLDSSNYNHIAWTNPSGKVVSQYKIYRTTAGGTPSSTGLIGTVNAPTLFLNDTGLSASGSVPTVNTTGNVGIGVSVPTASLHLRAGTASAGTAPIKINSGTNLTAVEDGAIEYDGTHFYVSVGSSRYPIDQQTTGATNFSRHFAFMGA